MLLAALKIDIAEGQTSASSKGCQRHCGVIILASNIRVDDDDSEHYLVFYAHVMRSALGASVVVALDINCTITTARIRTIALS